MNAGNRKLDVLARLQLDVEVAEKRIAEIDRGELGEEYRHLYVSVLEKARAVRAIVNGLAIAAQKAIPFLRDEGANYEDDGTNEPLETARELESALDRLRGDA